jgi:hypothetical protein
VATEYVASLFDGDAPFRIVVATSSLKLDVIRCSYAQKTFSECYNCSNLSYSAIISLQSDIPNRCSNNRPGFGIELLLHGILISS